MIHNRSAPPASIIPVLTYPDVAVAVEWLTRVFGLVEHVRIGDHRAQLGFGDGALIVADASYGRGSPAGSEPISHSIMLRVPDIDLHYQRAVEAGAEIREAPADRPFGERQYSAIDVAGHHWIMTQSIADLRPEEWGGTTVSGW